MFLGGDRMDLGGVGGLHGVGSVGGIGDAGGKVSGRRAELAFRGSWR